MTSFMEKSKSRLKLTGRRASLNVWAGQLGSLLGLDIFGDEDLYLPVASGRHILAFQSYDNQTVNNEFLGRESKSCG